MPYDRCAIEEYVTDNGPADYALCVDGRLVGIVEAKKLTLGPQNVLTQAERYSRGASANPLNFRGFHVPFLYSTNGEIVWHHDIRNPLSRSEKMAHFHTPDALVERLEQNFETACLMLLRTPNDHPRLRDYQRDANAEIEKALTAVNSVRVLPVHRRKVGLHEFLHWFVLVTVGRDGVEGAHVCNRYDVTAMNQGRR